MAKTIVETIIDIDKKVCTLSKDEKNFIKETLLFHECEPIAAAEKISEYLKVDYNSIFDLL